MMMYSGAASGTAADPTTAADPASGSAATSTEAADPADSTDAVDPTTADASADNAAAGGAAAAAAPASTPATTSASSSSFTLRTSPPSHFRPLTTATARRADRSPFPPLRKRARRAGAERTVRNSDGGLAVPGRRAGVRRGRVRAVRRREVRDDIVRGRRAVLRAAAREQGRHGECDL